MRYVHPPELSPGLSSLSLMLLSVLLWTSIARARFVDLSVDDTGLTYGTEGLWEPQRCEGCGSLPNPSNAYLGSWHESLYVPGGDIPLAWLNFTGGAIFVFCIIPNMEASPNRSTNLFFVLDGEPVGSYRHVPDGNSPYLYQVPVFVRAALPMTQHSIEIHNGARGLTNQSLVLLDYVTYTIDDPNPLPSTSPPFTLPITPSSTAIPPNPGSPQPAPTPTGVPIPTPSIRPPQAIISNNFNPANIAIPVSIGGAIALAAVIGFGMRYWKRYKQSRLPPSAQWRQSAGAAATEAAGGTSPTSPTTEARFRDEAPGSTTAGGALVASSSTSGSKTSPRSTEATVLFAIEEQLR